MSVPKWKQQLSNADYVYKTYILNIEIGRIFANKPKKYKQNYADKIIKSALTALEHLQIVDSIYLTKYSQEAEYELRHKHLLEARGIIQHVATASYVFLEMVRKHDFNSEATDEKLDKLYDQEIHIGEMCEECFKLINSIIKSDKELCKKYIMPKKA